MPLAGVSSRVWCQLGEQLLNPEDIAALASYVASPAARGMTGAVLDIDLGWTAR